MRPLRVYADTSVIGASLDPVPVGRREMAAAFMENVQNGALEMVISSVVLEEINKAPDAKKEQLLKLLRRLPVDVLEESNESADLASEYMAVEALPSVARDDARHIAVATVNGVGVLVSWNFRHMANMRIIHSVNAVNLRSGYRTIEIVPPEEVMDYGAMGI